MSQFLSPRLIRKLRLFQLHDDPAESAGIKVEAVLRAVPLSRRILESRFQKLLGRTPHEEITRIQVERVKELLTETDLSLSAIAHRAGYRHVEYMSVAFKRETGQPPSVYRAVHHKKT